jgi:hypothetical protein
MCLKRHSHACQQATPESKLPLNSDSKEENKEQTENTDKDTDVAGEKQTSAKEPDNPKSQS